MGVVEDIVFLALLKCHICGYLRDKRHHFHPDHSLVKWNTGDS